MFADIILPFALEKNYTYVIPAEFEGILKPGMRAEVSFRKKIYTGIIAKIHDRRPEGYSLKPILALPDHLHVINKIQLDFWKWISQYYLCTEGEVMQAALPAAYKLSSETILVLDNDKKIDSAKLTDKEYIVAEALTIQNELTLSEIQKILQQKSIQPIVKTLIENGIAYIKEELKETFKAKTEKYLLLHPQYSDEKTLEELFNKLEQKESLSKQLHALMIFYQEAQLYGKIKRSVLLRKSGISTSVLATMIKHGIFIEQIEETSRLKGNNLPAEQKDILLSTAQKNALGQIIKNFQEKDVVLLHGITGSGKTELYIELIKQYLKTSNAQILYLLPEIALTAQIINRLKKYFGGLVGIYHSKFSQNERVEIWQKILKKEYRIVIGARSALFLPFPELSLTIIDEEHDYSYKQHDQNPRYHARDAAIYLSKLHQAKTLLGTATPAIETYYNAQTNKYGYVNLSERYAQIELPKIEIIHLSEALKKTNKTQSFLSKELQTEIQNSLEKKEQVIIFQNRRGFAPFVICESCGWVPQCINCDVKLVYHKYADELRCHYCGYKRKTFPVCPACNSSRILIQGLGTEKIEDELQILFPEKKIARLDLDSVRTKNGFERVISAFEEGETDILVGTQMVTKGFDFDNVNLVGIIHADQTWNFPDFRANERAYQMLTQVSGRAGRKNKKGLVIMQCLNPSHPVLYYVIENNYKALYEAEIFQRQKFDYPPFTRLIKITLKHKEIEIVSAASKFMASELQKKLGKRVLGPVLPPIAKIRNKIHFEILLKLKNNTSEINQVKHHIASSEIQLFQQAQYKQVDIVIDVDPL